MFTSCNSRAQCLPCRAQRATKILTTLPKPRWRNRDGRGGKDGNTGSPRQHPSSVEGYNLLGIIETNQQDYAGALVAFNKALKLAPNS